MGRKRLTMSEKIRRYIAANPNAKPKEVATALEVKPSLVYAVKFKGANNVRAPGRAFVVEVPVPKAVQEGDWKTVATVTSSTSTTLQPEIDIVNQPPHYTDGGIETIDFIQAKLTREEFVGYLKGNAIKYGSRIGKKGEPQVDAGKMAWYATKLREVLTVA